MGVYNYFVSPVFGSDVQTSDCGQKARESLHGISPHQLARPNCTGSKYLMVIASFACSDTQGVGICRDCK